MSGLNEKAAKVVRRAAGLTGILTAEATLRGLVLSVHQRKRAALLAGLRRAIRKGSLGAALRDVVLRDAPARMLARGQAVRS